MMPLSASLVKRHVLVPRPSWCVFQSRSLVGWKPKSKLASQKPGVWSCSSHVLPAPSAPLVLHMMFLGLLKLAAALDEPDVMLALDRLMTWPSCCAVGMLVLPRPVKTPPNIMLPLAAFAMDVTGPLTPEQGSSCHPLPATQAMAFVEAGPLKLPPTKTVLRPLPQSTAVTWPERPDSGVICELLGLKRAMPVDCMPARLVKLPPMTTPDMVPFCSTSEHMVMTDASVLTAGDMTPLGMRARRAWLPFVLKGFSFCSSKRYIETPS